MLAEWPVERPRNWARLLADSLSKKDVEAIRTSIRRGRPFGDAAWIERTAKRLGLGFTLRDRGRPRKHPEEQLVPPRAEK